MYVTSYTFAFAPTDPDSSELFGVARGLYNALAAVHTASHAPLGSLPRATFDGVFALIDSSGSCVLAFRSAWGESGPPSASHSGRSFAALLIAHEIGMSLVAATSTASAELLAAWVSSSAVSLRGVYTALKAVNDEIK